eukprot:CAMPEP_0167752354 /NCGR_PEP_ID=MMETSP0110_2-20121227/7092_1 /TAXON_ID=629695 /ORGANISM="Gymnochlora sp., Strain CCMP2014" /LENGTH=326 /DNA_ID=CAMNT_0007637961 /DNA_START=360 /DNA_END=1340 /DNA_ORIENTATION=-
MKNSIQRNHSISQKTLVVILGSTYGHSITFPTFLRRVLYPLEADLALAVSRPKLYHPLRVVNSHDSLYQTASYTWGIDKKRKYLDSVLIDYVKECRPELLNEVSNFPLITGSQLSKRMQAFEEIVLFRWLALSGIYKDRLWEKYTHFIFTSADLLYTAHHPPVRFLLPGELWVPSRQNDDGMHMVVHRDDLVVCLNLIDELLQLRRELQNIATGTKEVQVDEVGYVLQRHYSRSNLTRTSFPRIMFAVFDENDPQQAELSGAHRELIKNSSPEKLEGGFYHVLVKYSGAYKKANDNFNKDWAAWIETRTSSHSASSDEDMADLDDE